MKYKDLSEKEKQNFRAYYTENMIYDGWWDCVYEHFKMDYADKGFKIEEINFSGFWSQGDGASWTGKVDRYAFIKNYTTEADPNFAAYQFLRGLIQDTWLDDYTLIGHNNSRYSHDGCMCIENGDDMSLLDAEEFEHFYPRESNSEPTISAGTFKGVKVRDILEAADLPRVLDDLEAHILQEARGIAREIYRELEKEYEFLTSDEYIAELAEINEWEFDEDGKMQ